MPGREFYVYELSLADGLRHAVSPVDPDWLFGSGFGLCTEAIVGILALGTVDLRPDHFQPNPAFARFLHETIADDLFVAGELRAAARELGAGRLPLLDARTPDPAGAVPAHDVLGTVAVRDGDLVPGTYRANDAHVLLSDDGFFALPPELEMALDKRIRQVLPREDAPILGSS